MTKICPSCNKECDTNHTFCPHCGHSAPSENETPLHENGVLSNSLSNSNLEPMRYFQFIIYFQLFITAGFCLFSAFSILTSEAFHPSLRYYPEYETKFKVLRISYHVAMLSLGVDALVTRWHLANFKAKGPTYYIRYLIVNTVFTLIFMVWSNILLSEVGLWANQIFTVAGIIANSIMALACCIYFDEREHLFVN